MGRKCILVQVSGQLDSYVELEHPADYPLMGSAG